MNNSELAIRLINGGWAPVKIGETETQKLSLSDLQAELDERDQLFGFGIENGWRPLIDGNGDVCLDDGTVIYNDPRFKLPEGKILRVEWTP